MDKKKAGQSDYSDVFKYWIKIYPIYPGHFSGPPTLITSTGAFDIYVLKLHCSGALQVIFKFGITVDSSGNSYITGYFQGTVDFGGGNVTSAGSNDIFVLKLNSLGRGIEYY